MTILPPMLALASALLLAGPAHAQDASHRLADGRTITVAMPTPGCEDQRVDPDDRFVISMVYGCGAVGSGTDGEGAVVVSHVPGSTTPRGFLLEHVKTLLPAATEAEAEAQIMPVEVQTRGDVARFLCFSGENADHTRGLIYCVLDQPNTQVMIGAESYDFGKAADVLFLISSGLTIR